MKYYHVDMFVKYLSFDCMVYDDITKQEVKKWVNDTYCRCGLFARVQEIERLELFGREIIQSPGFVLELSSRRLQYG